MRNSGYIPKVHPTFSVVYHYARMGSMAHFWNSKTTEAWLFLLSWVKIKQLLGRVFPFENRHITLLASVRESSQVGCLTEFFFTVSHRRN